MRVVSGSSRGTHLLSPEGLEFRPTLDHVKEAVFSMLISVSDLNVLDLFSGSGGLGIEALSRGAMHAVFVDKSKYSLDITKSNLKKTHLEDKASCVLSDYKSYILGNSEKFDLVFLDPPYKEGLLTDAIALLGEKSLNFGARLVCEMEASDIFEVPDGFSVIKDKKYGRCRVIVLEK